MASNRDAIPPPLTPPSDAPLEEQDEADALCKVYVGRLTPHANETHLQAFFRPFGVIRHIWIARRPPGFAFVTYLKAADATHAVEAVQAMADPAILGQTIRCQLGGDTTSSMPATDRKRKRVRTKKGETFKVKKARKLAAITTQNEEASVM
ncbi:hypothetical protein SDRG_11706 [Saprolegnia diclina VS20]|uniref:RRM domain-containing protein n=1 Tax=Saprolegnia diclina (strain VS20) TaxID=1156394 RepID=T0Q7P3_SAPDV|nr:hypothetical protein SDRG_11706 [Saprolegnia diclina VS20]EQC30651.1 hypothetical protein SDRG_11706 [Saprolegnia diclina VS20]|eukprot:XP_008615977.1 hypothetical protein SDRG_11706 [Saprolegnia diclina VS20]